MEFWCNIFYVNFFIFDVFMLEFGSGVWLESADCLRVGRVSNLSRPPTLR